MPINSALEHSASSNRGPRIISPAAARRANVRGARAVSGTSGATQSTRTLASRTGTWLKVPGTRATISKDEVCRRFRPGPGLQSGALDRIKPLGEGQGILPGAGLEKAIEV